MTYHNNWHNVCDSTVTFRNAETRRELVVNVPDGKYTKLGALCRELYALVSRSSVMKHVRVGYDGSKDKPYLNFIDATHTVKFSVDLADVLGFVPDKEYSGNGERVYPEYVKNLDGAYDNLYVYCSLCANRVVGDALAPCLMNVPVRSATANTNLIHERVSNPMYVPVVATDTDTVEIDIRRGDGQPVLFRGGNVIVTVHVREKRRR